MKFRENEDAVSPVIGVILMVAITVILAAVIAAFVFGMTDNVQTSKTVVATASQQINDITVTYQGGPDANIVTYLRVEVDGTANYYWAGNDNAVDSDTSAPDSSEAVAGKLPAGKSWKYSGGTSEKEHVVVAAHFADGSSQVILDTFV